MLNATNRNMLIVCLLLVFHLQANAEEEQNKVVSCPPVPTCADVPQCNKVTLERPRNNRDCRKRIFGISISDPACEATKAAANASYSKELYNMEAMYRQCLDNQRSIKLKCDIEYTDWEECMSILIESYPPQNVKDRKQLYFRCINKGGKDEFTDDCCSHLYSSDRRHIGVCK